MIRVARPSDRNAFHDLAKTYIAESGQNRVYSSVRTQSVFEGALEDNGTLLLVAEGLNELAGGILLYIDPAFTEEPVCLVSMFYIRKEYRGTALARSFMNAVVSFADDAGCSHTFAAANGMIGDIETQMFVNLCSKFGFKPAGSPVLYRVKK